MIALTACLALLTAADGAGAGVGEVRIGSYSAMTGSASAIGVAQHNGAVLAAEEINEAGGVLVGQQIVIVDADDEGNAEKSVQVVKDLIENKKVVAVIGPATTEAANATVAYTNKLKIPHVLCSSPGALVNELFKEYPQNYVFRFAAPDFVQSKMMLTEAIAARGKRQLAVIADDTPYGQAGRLRLERMIANRDMKPVYVANVKVGEKDLAPVVAAAKEAKADALLLYTSGAETAGITRAVESMKWKVDVIGTWTHALPSFMKVAGSAGERLIFPQTFIEGESLDPTQLVFIDSYKRRWGVPHIEAGPVAAQAYDAVHLIAQAIQQAGTTDPAKVKSALEDLDMLYVGATGEYYKPWMPDDHEAVTPANVLWAKVKGGLIVPVYPPSDRDRE
jgi:branched-chain amino acid transport system substrate-binding protein